MEYAVTARVTGDGVYTFALVPTSSDGLAAMSREGGTAPVLLYTLADGPAPGPVCGDASCDAGESCSTCATDCGECPGPADTVVLQADAQVAAAQPTTNFGSAASLGVDSSPLLESYLRFEVSGVTTEITSAKLRLKVIDATSDGPAVYAADSGWTEAGVTWNGRPAHSGSALADLGALTLGAVVEVDVTSLVSGNGVYTLALVPTSSSGFAVASREGGTAPELVLTTGSGPAPTCGDDACDGAEGCASCEADCGTCPAPVAIAVLEADGQVAAASPTASFGGATALGADASPEIESYLRFRVSGTTGPLTRARLRLTVTDATSDGPAIHAADSAWSEDALTWAARPARSAPSLADLGALAVGDVAEIDVTALVTGDGVYTLALVPTSSSGFAASSREGASPPELVIE